MPAQKKLFRLKAGGFTQGEGADHKVFYSNDPNRNIIESELDLAADEPMKFEEYKGERPAYLGGDSPLVQRTGTDAPGSVSVSGSGRAPLPTTADQLAEAAALSGDMTVEDAERKAEHFEELAKRLREAAKQTQASIKKGGGKVGSGEGAGSSEGSGATAGNLTEEGRKANEGKGGKAQSAKAQQGPSDEELEGMSKADLKALAEEREIEVSAKATKEDLLEALRSGK